MPTKIPTRHAKTHLTKEDAVEIAKPDHLSSAASRFSKRLSHLATKMARFNMASALE